MRIGLDQNFQSLWGISATLNYLFGKETLIPTEDELAVVGIMDSIDFAVGVDFDFGLPAAEFWIRAFFSWRCFDRLGCYRPGRFHRLFACA